MTQDPLTTYRNDIAVHLPWRPIPTEYMLGTVANLRLHSGVELLFWKLWLCADDAGRFVASAHHLARKTDLREKTIMRKLEALVEARLVETYVVDGQSYGLIRGFNELVKMPRTNVVLYPPPPEGGREGQPEGAGEGGVVADVPTTFPPTPPFLTQDQRPESESSLARVQEQAGARETAQAVPPLPPGVMRGLDSWWSAYQAERQALPTNARQVTRSALVHAVRELTDEHGVTVVRRALHRCRAELNNANQRKWWGDPLGNLARKVRFAVEDAGGRLVDDEHAREVEPSAVTPATSAAVPSAVPDEVPQVTPDPELEARWKGTLERLCIEPWDLTHWVAPLSPAGKDPAGLPVLLAPDSSHASWVREHFGPFIEQAMGSEVRIVPWALADAR